MITNAYHHSSYNIVHEYKQMLHLFDEVHYLIQSISTTIAMGKGTCLVPLSGVGGCRRNSFKLCALFFVLRMSQLVVAGWSTNQESVCHMFDISIGRQDGGWRMGHGRADDSLGGRRRLWHWRVHVRWPNSFMCCFFGCHVLISTSIASYGTRTLLILIL